MNGGCVRREYRVALMACAGAGKTIRDQTAVLAASPAEATDLALQWALPPRAHDGDILQIFGDDQAPRNIPLIVRSDRR